MNNLRARIKGPSLESDLLPKEGSQGKDTTAATPKGSTEPVQVEPKTFFANERTFIQWISAALLLLTVSSIMMSGANTYNGTSGFIAFCALVLVVYSAFIYFRRVELLRSGSGYGYLDVLGPSILAAGVGLGVFIVLADSIKGNDILTGERGRNDDDDRRRSLVGREEALLPSFLLEAPGKCIRHPTKGLNLLEFQPRDVTTLTDSDRLVVATPQSLVSVGPAADNNDNKILTQVVPDVVIESVVAVGNSVYALSTGPTKTELIEFDSSALLMVPATTSLKDDVDSAVEIIKARYMIQDKSSNSGSITFVPSNATSDDKGGSFYIHLDGSMHTYRLKTTTGGEKKESSTLLSRVGTINMNMIRGNSGHTDDPAARMMITSMTHFEGVTYLLRSDIAVIDAWDLAQGKFLAEIPLPAVDEAGPWVGMAFERRQSFSSLLQQDPSPRRLRKNQAMVDSTPTSLRLHMSLDTFPPQIWTFLLEEHQQQSGFGFPDCSGIRQIN